MCEISECSENEHSSGTEGKTGINPKVEPLELDLPTTSTPLRHSEDNTVSSSGSNLRASFVGMGFLPYDVDRAIKEKGGDDDADLLLETLLTYSAPKSLKAEVSDSFDWISRYKNELTAYSCGSKDLKRSCSDSSDSIEFLFGDDEDMSNCLNGANAKDIQPNEVPSGKRASLLLMDFSSSEVDFALDKLGGDVPVSELMDFIFAARMEESPQKDISRQNHNGSIRIEENDAKPSFGTTDKRRSLLEMGFDEKEASAAIEKHGSDVPVAELADSIIAYQNSSSTFLHTCHSNATNRCNSLDAASRFKDFDVMEKIKRKRLNEECFGKLYKLKRPKEEYDDEPFSSIGINRVEARAMEILVGRCETSALQRKLSGTQRCEDGIGISKPLSCRSVNGMVSRPPYFFLGTVVNLCQNSWAKISRFMYAIEPEFVNTELFSALSRKEGYIHNLPTKNRFCVSSKSPKTFQEAIPNTKKWWPLWDTRKKLSSINCQTSGVSQQCGRLQSMLIDSRGVLSSEQQRDILHQCKVLNLVWADRHKVSPVDPENLELILGYPLHHTSGLSLTERFQSMEHCFQTDTLVYCISELMPLFPDGLTVLSIYSGIGGAEISLHRLGIRLKAVVSVEPSESKRRILRQWWRNTEQSGELVQVEDIQKLTTNRLGDLIKKVGGFDFIICQNPHPFSAKNFDIAGDGGGFATLDFPRFYEFVRVLQRVRSRT